MTDTPSPEYEYRVLQKNGNVWAGGPYPSEDIARAVCIVDGYKYTHCAPFTVECRIRCEHEWEPIDV